MDLGRTRRLLIRSINGIKADIDAAFAQQMTQDSLDTIEVLIESLKDYHMQAKDLVDAELRAIDRHDKPSAVVEKEEDDTYALIDDIQKALCKYIAKLTTQRRLLHAVISPPRQSTARADATNATFLNASVLANTPNLKMTLPKFAGEIRNYASFRNMFTQMIDRLPIEDSMKLYHLKSCMTKDAADLLRDFDITDEAYAEAWKHLASRYENKRAVVNTLFNDLMNLESIKSESSLRKLLDTVDGIVRGLSVQGYKIGTQDNDAASPMIAYIVSSKLDSHTRRDWENSIQDNNRVPKYEELIKFLSVRSISYESRNPLSSEHSTTNDKTSKKQSGEKPNVEKTSSAKKSFVTTQPQCVLCDKQHSLGNCSVYLAKSNYDRYQFVRNGKLCINCLGKDHMLNSCPVQTGCKKCKAPHHTTLHREQSSRAPSRPASPNSSWRQQPRQDAPSPHPPQMQSQPQHTQNSTNSYQSPQTQQSQATPSTTSNNANRTCMFTGRYQENTVLLPTAVVKVFHEGRFYGKARVLLDSCSQVTLITESFIRKTQLPTHPHPFGTVTVSGVSGNSQIDRMSSFIVRSRHSRFEVSLDAEVVQSIPYRVPDNSKLPLSVSNLRFADEDLPHSHVDILIGGSHYERCILNEREFHGDIVLRNSQFGWLISGSTPNDASPSLHCGLTLVDTESVNLDRSLRRFWELESIKEEEDIVTESESECVRHFEDTYSRMPDGRFVVRLPFKIDPSKLGESRSIASRMLTLGERKSSSEVRNEYSAFMSEYIALDHMEKVNANTPGYFIPHQMVQKPTSTTTKYRVVFNASAKTNSGLSLNDTLMIGPTIQPELIDTLIRFRTHKVAVIGDIEKMYRQVLVHPDDRKYQRILWRADPALPPDTYELKTVTYGTAPASFLSTKCLDVLADECRDSDPLVSQSIKDDFYVDDWISGAATPKDTQALATGVIAQLAKGQFKLRKISSNSEELLQSLPPDQVETIDNYEFDSKSVLGIRWCPSTDTIGVSLHGYEVKGTITKRVVASASAKIFDPIGMFSPVTINAKILLQQCWIAKRGWDEPVPNEIAVKFQNFISGLIALTDYSIDRRIKPDENAERTYLIGFADASESAYCAVAYLVTVDHDSQLTSRFICAKTRVAPIKALTVPSLELCAALLASILVKRIARLIKIEYEHIMMFSDSQVVIDWMHSDLSKVKIYVRNRVNDIRKLLPTVPWFHVSSGDNPADLGTRGIDSVKFTKSTLWKFGAPFSEDVEIFDRYMSFSPTAIVHIAVAQVETQASPSPRFNLLERYSSYRKLLNVVAYIYRFAAKAPKRSGHIALEEVEHALNVVTRLSQREMFAQEYDNLMKRNSVSNRSSLSSLAPYVDTFGIIRVGGRLQNSAVSHDRKHPTILHTKSPLVELIVRYIHEEYYHANPSFIANFLSSRYWIIGGVKNTIKKVTHRCTICIRYRARTMTQQMGPLPEGRVTTERPFARIGIDFAGPFTCKCVNHRVTKFYKIYLCVFVCFVTRAIHLEIVSSLSTDAFLDCLERFIARRGIPARICSDNATNFVGASNILRMDSSRVARFAVGKSIKWIFIPPRTPHQGGLWEAAVRSAKHHLTRVTNGQTLNFEEYMTYFCGIEAILNSRPICYRTDASSNIELLTPSHFIMGSPVVQTAQLDESTQASNVTYSRRYVMIQDMIASFWTEWKRAYLTQLQLRNKWKRPTSSLGPDDVVIVRDDLQPPSSWKLGRVIATYPDSAGLTRNVDVLFGGGIKRRNVTSLVRITPEDPDDPQPGENVDGLSAVSMITPSVLRTTGPPSPKPLPYRTCDRLSSR